VRVQYSEIILGFIDAKQPLKKNGNESMNNEHKKFNLINKTNFNNDFASNILLDTNFSSNVSLDLPTPFSEPPIKQIGCNNEHFKPDIKLKIVDDSLQSHGQPLDKSTKQSMESFFGFDFSKVRIHSDESSATLAKKVSANAFTIKNHIFFDSGRYNPSQYDGKKLVAHELTHVIQQERGRNSDPTPVPGSLLEHESESAESLVTAQKPIKVSGASAQALARQPVASKPAEIQKTYQYINPDGQTITLNEEQYNREVQRVKHNLEADLKTIEDHAKGGLQDQQSMLAEYQGGVESPYDIVKKPKALIGIFADIKAGVVPPNLNIWTWPKNYAKAGHEELKRGNIKQAAIYLRQADASLRDATSIWNQYRLATIGGAERVVSNLETVRDTSFAIAVASAVVIAAPVVAAGAAELGATGLTGTLLTEGTLAVGGGVMGAGLRAGSSAIGQKLVHGQVRGKELKKEAVEGFRKGTQAASLVRGPLAQPLAQFASAGVETAAKQKVDWTKVTVDALVDMLLNRYMPKFSNSLVDKIISQNPAAKKISREILREAAKTIIMHTGISTVKAAVDEFYQQGLKGKGISLERLSDEVLKRISDPSGLIYALVVSRAVGSAKGSYPGQAAAVPKPSVEEEAAAAAAPTIKEPAAAAAVPTIKEPAAAAAVPKPSVEEEPAAAAAPTIKEPAAAAAVPTIKEPAAAAAVPTIKEPAAAAAVPTIKEPAAAAAVPTIKEPAAAAVPKPSVEEEAAAAAVPKPSVEEAAAPKNAPLLPEKAPPKSQRPRHGELAAMFNRKEPLPRWAINIASNFRGEAAERLIRLKLHQSGANFLRLVRIRTSYGRRDVDYLIKMPDGSYLALEIKRGGSPYTARQQLLDKKLSTEGGRVISESAAIFGLPKGSKIGPFETFLIRLRE
jgi:Domain of unknown function (DUF4157)